MTFRNNFLVATVNAVALMAAGPVSAADDKPQDVMKSTQPIVPKAAFSNGMTGSVAADTVAVGAIGSDWVPTKEVASS